MKIKQYIILYLIVISGFLSFSQQNRDSILINEQTIDRPLSLHKGQLQTNAAYNFSIISADFDDVGRKLNVAELGKAYVLHEYMFNIHYGIFDFLEVAVALDYNKKAVRDVTEVYLSAYGTSYDVYYLDDYRSFDDLLIGLRISNPFKNNVFDLFLESGIYLPIFNQVPKEPGHTIEFLDDARSYAEINYIYNHTFSNKIPVLQFGFGTKLKYKKLALSLFGDLSFPLGVSESSKWLHQLDGSTFEYTEVPYEFLISNNYSYKAKIEYQPLPWFNVNLNFLGLHQLNGWSEESSIRLAYPEKYIIGLSAGYEIKVTGKLWLTQDVYVPVIGQNQVATLSFLTGLSYNIFPFSTIKFNK